MYYPMLDAVGFLMMAGLLFSFSLWLTGYFVYAVFVYYHDWARSIHEEPVTPVAPTPLPVPVERKEEPKLPRAA